MVIYASPNKQTTPSRMSEILDLTRTSATRLSDELVNKGWVAREHCEADRRQVILSLTPSGQELIHIMVPILSAARSRLLHNFSDAEIENLDGLMRKLLENVDDENARLLAQEKK
jgi:MarR family transcriptional repressor of emrRAB